MKNFNFTKYNPKIVVVEYLDLNVKKWEITYNNFNNVKKSKIYSLMIKNKYNFVNWVNGDLVFVKNKIKF